MVYLHKIFMCKYIYAQVEAHSQLEHRFKKAFHWEQSLFSISHVCTIQTHHPEQRLISNWRSMTQMIQFLLEDYGIGIWKQESLIGFRLRKDMQWGNTQKSQFVEKVQDQTSAKRKRGRPWRETEKKWVAVFPVLRIYPKLMYPYNKCLLCFINF